MGYRFSRQASLASFSPYFLLYGRDPDLPTSIRRESSEVVNLDDPNMWVRVCFQRAELFRRVMPAAFENLAIAQHRDTLRYATIRGGGYRPSIRRFHVGDYVYLQQTAPTTLDVTAGRTILRVREVLPSGVLLLEGRDGVVWKDHVRNCAPCHLPNVDGTMDSSLAVVRAGLRCMLCGSAGQAACMLVCDRCSRGWHMLCLTPPIYVIPAGRWSNDLLECNMSGNDTLVYEDVEEIRHPSLLPQSAIQGYHKALLSHISLLGGTDLDLVDHIDLMIAVWPCQDHTRTRHEFQRRRQMLDEVKDMTFLTWIVSLDLAKQQHLCINLVVSTSLVSSLSTGTVESMARGDKLDICHPWSSWNMMRGSTRVAAHAIEEVFHVEFDLTFTLKHDNREPHSSILKTYSYSVQKGFTS
ncbi:hypothetical protein MARPO_0060s0038 [Marchantia polymorpha]|uniref:Zinc finger PHD-type domain-containing protein n=1 Tax=Marchantia polymorpha TaxID=3197 RepID=A0A2R6WSW7_MARPO|nr:hypothetical protein MARPO_0060s0038 [Marchantia polymorpha]|eukprot:PTQ36949.1 hypothetical protein MARPO_0060s0038 [Marchantia polymorpha]